MKSSVILVLIILTTNLTFAQEKCNYPKCSPTFAEVFDYNVGDYFKYETHHISGSPGYDYSSKTTDSYTITAKYISGDTIQYTRQGKSKTITETNFFGSVSVDSNTSVINDTLMYINSADQFLNKCSGTLLDVGNIIYHYDLGYYTSVKTTQNECRLIKTVGGDLNDTNYFRVDSTGAITDTIIGRALSNLAYVKKESYANGLGLIHEFFAQNGGVDYTYGNLLEYIKACNGKPLPDPEITNGDTVVVCPGTNVVLRANKSNACTYQWYLNGSPVQWATGDTLVVTHFKESNGIGAGSYQVAESNDCDNRIISQPVQVVFRTTFYLPDHSGMSDTINRGENITLMPYVQDFHNTTLTYSWDADPTLSATNIENPVATPDSSHTYKLTVSDGTCSDSTLFHVIVRPPNPECSPTYAEVFDFNVGDYFKYETHLSGGSPDFDYYSTTTDSYTITGKHVSGDTIQYTRLGKSKEITERDFFGNKSVSSSTSVINDTLTYINSADQFLNKCPGTLVGVGDGYYTMIKTTQNECMMIKTYGGDSNYYNVDSTGAITDTITGYGLHNIPHFVKESYAKGYGLISDYTIPDPQEVSYGSLIGYIKAPNNDSITPAEITNGDTVEICLGSKVMLRANKSKNLSYQWLKNGTAILGATNDTLMVADSGQYRVVETDSCKSRVTSDITQVIVYRLKIQNNNYNIDCGGILDIGLTGTVDYNGHRPLTYTWEGDSTLISTRYQFAIVNPTTTHVYKLTVSNGLCEDADSFIVTVNPITVSINTDSENVSCGDTLQLITTTNYIGGDSLTYRWSPSDGLSATNIPNPVVTVGTTKDYMVTVKEQNGCIGSDSIHLTTSSANYTPVICRVTVDSNNKNNIVWQTVINEAIDSVYIYRESTEQIGEYDVIGKLPVGTANDFEDTASDASVRSNAYKIAYKDICGFLTAPSAKYRTLHLDIQNETGNARNLSWKPYIGDSVLTYRIYRGTTKNDLEPIDTLSFNDTSYTDLKASEGNLYYQVEAITPETCSGQPVSNIVESTTTAVTGFFPTSIVTSFFYPNPAFNKLTIRKMYSSDKATIEIVNLQGKQVLYKPVDSNQLDISMLPKGVYIVKLIDSGNILINKLVKE